MKVGVVIPLYNEEMNVVPLVGKLLSALGHFDGEIVLVDDGSTDETGRLIDELADENDQVVAIHHLENSGYAQALKTGFKRGIDDMLDVICVMDGDMTHEAGDISRFLMEIERGADVVIGSRYVENGKMVDVPFRRVFISKAANFLFRLLLGLKVRDITSGYRAYRRKVLEKINIDSDSFHIHLEITAKSNNAGFKIREIPIVLKGRRFGASKFNLISTWWKYLTFVIKFRIRQMGKRKK